MARRRGDGGDPLARATVQAAEHNRRGVVEAARLSRNGVVGAAKVQAMAVIIGAVVAGTCGVAGVGVQGYWAAEVEKVKAESSQSPRDLRAGPFLAGVGPEAEVASPGAELALLEDFCRREPGECVQTVSITVHG